MLLTTEPSFFHLEGFNGDAFDDRVGIGLLHSFDNEVFIDQPVVERVLELGCGHEVAGRL